MVQSTLTILRVPPHTTKQLNNQIMPDSAKTNLRIMQIEGCKSGARSITKPGAVGNLHAASPASEDGNVFKLFGLQHFVAEDVYLFFPPRV